MSSFKITAVLGVDGRQFAGGLAQAEATAKRFGFGDEEQGGDEGEAMGQATFLADSIGSFQSVSVSSSVQEDLLKKLASLIDSSYKNLGKLEAAVARSQGIADTVKKSESYRDKVVTAMQALRTDVDALEMIVPRDMWPVPNYTDLLFKL